MSKYTKIVDLLKERIKGGYYVLHAFPPETSLAMEVGAARVTVRKAIGQLISQGLLVRLPTGRVALDRSSMQTKPQLAFLAPAYINSHDANLCQTAAKNADNAAGANLHQIEYAQWDDPAIANTLRSFDGIFFKPWSEATPIKVIDAMRSSGRPVVTFDQDLTAFGIRSICPFPPVFVQRLLDHCAGLGHRHIDCFNTQPVDPVIEQRIEQWRIWLAAHGMTGTLHSATGGNPLQHGYELMLSLLEADRLTASALLCTTGPAAIGAMRALHEKQINVGTDVSVCAVNDEGLGRYLVPSLTAIEMPDLVPQLTVCAQWMIRGGTGWIGPLLMQPAEVQLFVGESVGPLREAS